MNIQWHCKAFNELLPDELYKMLRLRNEVFVVEQNCVFQDADNKDQQCLHLGGYINDELVAYTRLSPPEYIYEEASIGRVVTSPAHRGKGLGKILLKESLEQCKIHFGNAVIKIGAQYHLLNFYNFFGFIPVGEIYLEDEIEHIHMVLKQNNSISIKQFIISFL